jgi:hypothetical protein
MNLRRTFKNKFNNKQDVLRKYPGILGNGYGLVDAGNGKVYVRISNTVNTAYCSGTPYVNNLEVWVGYSVDIPNDFIILGQRINQEYVEGIGKHANQHEWMGAGVTGGTDVLKVHLQQFLPLMVMPYSGFQVMVYPGIVWTAGGYKLIADVNSYGKPIPQIINLQSYAPSTNKELYVLVGIDDNGDIELIGGNEVDKGTIALTDIPLPTDTIKYKLAGVRRYNEQEEIIVNREGVDIVDLRFPMWRAPDYGDIVDLPDTFPPDPHTHDQYIISPFENVGDLLVYNTLFYEDYVVENVDRTGNKTITVNTVSWTAEQVILDCTLEIPATGQGNPTIDVNVWVSQNQLGCAKNITLRIRRDDISGDIIWNDTQGMTDDSSAGHNKQYTTSYEDTSPTTYKYVLTVQTVCASAVYSDIREFSVTSDYLEAVEPRTLPIGTEGQHLVVDSGVPAWVDNTGGASSLADLTDVDLTGLTDGDVLIYDEASGDWLPETPASGSSLTVQEIDTTPSVANVSVINITNGTLTDEGGGEITIDFGSAATDGSAIHNNEANEISAITEKEAPVAGDLIIIEDSEDGYTKKSVDIANLPSGGGGGGSESGVFASRPAAGMDGLLYLPTDGMTIDRDDGAMWSPWGPIFPFTPPVLTDFAWVNQGTATATQEKGGIFLKVTNGGSELHSNLKKSAPATPYTISIAFLLYGPPGGSDYGEVGLCFRQSADGITHVLRVDIYNGTLSLCSTKHNNVGGGVAHYHSVNANPLALGPVIWLRIADDGTNRICSSSFDGQHWATFHSVGRTDYLTADEVGFFIGGNNSREVGMHLLHWKQA